MALDNQISRGNTLFMNDEADEAQTSPMVLLNAIQDIDGINPYPVITLYCILTCSNIQLLHKILTPELEGPIFYPSGCPRQSDHPWQLPACYHNELPLVQKTNFQPQHGESVSNLEELGDDPPQMDIDNDEEDLNDANSNASTMTIPYYNTMSNSYGIFQSFLGEIPHFAPHGTLDSLCNSPNFDIAKMK